MYYNILKRTLNLINMKKVITIVAIILGVTLALYINTELEIIVVRHRVENAIETAKQEQEAEQERIKQAEYDNEARVLDSLMQVGLY